MYTSRKNCAAGELGEYLGLVSLDLTKIRPVVDYKMVARKRP